MPTANVCMYVYTDLLEGSVGLKPLAAVRGYASAKLLGVSRAWLFEPLPKKYKSTVPLVYNTTTDHNWTNDKSRERAK